MTNKNLSPAEKAIQVAGGVKELAALLGVHETRVFRWPRSEKVGGTNGRIPHQHHEKLLRLAKRNNWNFQPVDLIPNY